MESVSEAKKNSPYSMFEADKDIEKTGVIVDYGDFQIRIARAGGSNTKYQQVLEHVSKPYKRAIVNEVLDQKLVRKIMTEVYAKAVILGWEGNVVDREGNALVFNYENCIKLFTDLPDLFDDLQEQAQKLALFRKLDTEADVKNSVTSSGMF